MKANRAARANVTMDRSSPESYVDINVKARCYDLLDAEEKLMAMGAVFQGEDQQVDTFYCVDYGKLKWRQGSIENLVTHYVREDVNGEWHTRVLIYEQSPDEQRRREILGNRSIIGQVKKTRRIFFIDNVKFHLDRFEDGKSFVEIEAMDKTGDLGREKLRTQANYFKARLSIKDEDLLKISYIDLLAP